VPDLVALQMAGGDGFVAALRRAWDAGDAVAPIDVRLPEAEVGRVLAALAPRILVRPDGSTQVLDGGVPTADGDALVMATSGSTGSPKAVVLTHDALAASAQATSARLEVDPARDHWLACLPLAHIGGLSVVIRSLLTATPCTVHPGFRADAVAELGRRGEITHVSLVATALRRVDPSWFTCILLGGAAPPGDLPDNVVTTYGMTETGSGVVYDSRPLAGVEVAIAGTAGQIGTAGGTGQIGTAGTAGQIGTAGGTGQILLRAPMLARGYRDAPLPTAVGPDGASDWFATGDAGHLDASGELSVVGRLAEVVVTGGEKVWPAAVEQVLSGAPGVAEVAVWKRSDPEWGERVVAWVVPTAGGTVPTQADLAARVAGELAPWAAPKEVVVVSELPRTGSGKVRRSALR